MGQVGDGAGIDFSIFPEGFPQQDAPVGNQSLFSFGQHFGDVHVYILRHYLTFVKSINIISTCLHYWSHSNLSQAHFTLNYKWQSGGRSA
jgi:hypothetical protein